MSGSSTAHIPEEIKQNQEIYHAHFDLEFVRQLLEAVYPILHDVYFRSEFVGFDDIPPRVNDAHPLILASNHSGMAFPWDAMLFGAGIIANSDYKEHIRALVAPMLMETHLMNPYQVPYFWEKMGGIPATFLNFETMMHYPHANLLIYPEGVPGIGKGFNRKYQLQRLATSFIRMSIKYKTDIVPFATVNAEYINPHSYSFDWINNLSKKVGIPFLPIGLFIFLIPLQPWIFYFALPAKLTFVRGRPISPFKMTDKNIDDLSQKEIEKIRNEIRDHMQEDLNNAVLEYGKTPYRMREFLHRLWVYRKYFPFYLPFCWPMVFEEFQRQYKRKNGKDVKLNFGFGAFIKFLFRNPITVCYFIPIIGWIPLLVRGYRQKT